MIGRKPYYGDKNGAWLETNPEEINRLIALIVYMGLVNVSTFHRYWSTKTLYHGLWARAMMSRDRFKALMATLHIVDPGAETAGDKLRKVSDFVEQIKSKCKLLYQPRQNVSIDERMVKSKHRSGIRQYIKNKPVKFGIKLWVLADSHNGYTYNFDIYTGKSTSGQPSENGLGYDVVMRLLTPLLHQGYHLFVDNFYTSIKLIKDLFHLGTPGCGTTVQNRRSFPVTMKDGKKWARKKNRGDMRWTRDGSCLIMQWKDSKVVTVLSSIHNANYYVMVNRKVKDGNTWNNIEIQKPMAIDQYNKHMNGVDISDQKLAKNNTLHKCVRWWKTLFYHIIDISVVNSFILFCHHQANNPDNEELKRYKGYSLLDFREELVRDLVGLNEYGKPPEHKPPPKEPSTFETIHIPIYGKEKKNCKVCYAQEKRELRIYSYCSAPQCNVYLHYTASKN